MKTKRLIIAGIAIVPMMLTSCNLFKKKKQDDVEFDFSVALKSGKTFLERGQTDEIVISSNIQNDSVQREYTFESSNEDRLTVDGSGYVVAQDQLGSVKIHVTEKNSEIKKSVELSIDEPSTPASGGYNYSSSSSAEDIVRRTEILGKLEKYAMDTHLTGISLFENGGYVKYSADVTLPTQEYISGYGFGILSEGTINRTTGSIQESNPNWVNYYHSAQTSDPGKINAWNASGSQVSDLNSYVTSSYFGTKLNDDKDGYEWYPVLATTANSKTVGSKTVYRPIAVNANPSTGLSKTWKIYVRTGAEGASYRYNGSRGGGFDGRDVQLVDYLTPFKMLLTGANKQSRGAEMAGDKTYGIKGAQAYYSRTRTMTKQDDIDNLWNTMIESEQLGLKTGSDANGSFIQIEILNEIDDFTAMYTLSSNLYSPLPESFIQGLADSGKVIDGIKNYGVASGQGASAKNIVDNTICLSPYFLETWDDNGISFKKNNSYFETGRYLLEGVRIVTFKNQSQEDLFLKFESKFLDACGVPQSRIADQKDDPLVHVTKGDSTFKLNVNTCSPARWNELNEKLWKNPESDKWNVKPWMSNENFLNGLFWSIDRKTFADKRGVQPSIDYFANSYLADAQNGIPYNSTNAHKEAIAKWHSVRDGVDNYGYDLTKAVKYFNAAVNELAASGDISLGTPSNPTDIRIHIRWMGSTDVNEYGNDIAKYFEDAFNNENVCGNRVKLTVDQDTVGDSQWEDVYNVYMMKGRFDLAFGAISGNTYNPLNFMEVLRSDNSSTFTLNWGPDTSKVDAKRPIVYDGKKWSYDSLWEVSDRGGAVDNGESVKLVKAYKMNGLPTKISGGASTNDYSLGVNQKVNLEFVNLSGVELNVSKVQVYVAGGSNFDVPFSYNKAANELTLTIDSALGAQVNSELNEINNQGVDPSSSAYVTFTRTRYQKYWTFEIYYTLSILGGTPTESYVTVEL